MWYLKKELMTLPKKKTIWQLFKSIFTGEDVCQQSCQ